MHNNLLLANPAGDDKLYVEDVFSTYLYTGNGSTQTITNGIDLTKGGLVWIKSRSAAANNVLVDSARGAYSSLASNTTDQKRGANTVTALSSTGFTVTNDTLDTVFANTTGVNGTTYASWTFRKAPKFFDVVTWTGNATARDISHSLGVSPGFIIIKRTDAVAQWPVWHRSLPANNTLFLNTTDNTQTASGYVTSVSASTFSLGTTGNVNAIGGSYVAYLFAHDTAADGVIQCGSYTGDGTLNGKTVTLGFEPQFVLIKRTDNAGNWMLFDSIRGISTEGTDPTLLANTSNAEDAAFGAIDMVDLTSTGFLAKGGGNYTNISGGSYVYLAIRRGPMRVPTDATKVFNSQIYTGDYTTSTPITGMNAGTDVVWNASRTPASGYYILDRLRGWYYWIPSSPAAEGTTVTWSQKTQTSLLPSAAWWGSSRSQVNYFFNRAPSFMDVVCYTGSGANKTQAHNLGVAPELMIVKRRNVGTASAVYSSSLANTEYLIIASTAAKTTGATYWNSTTPTSSAFSIGTSASVNASGGTYVAYLFASCPGVSKVGSYTGYPSQTIDCGFTNGARFVLIKRTDSTGDWYVWDTTRGIIAANDPYLLLNSSAVEVTNTDYIDPVSTGFSISGTAPDAINKVAGVSWGTAISVGGSSTLAVGYGNGLFVAAGSSGSLHTSTTGSSWTSRTSNFGTSTIYGHAYGNGIHVVVGAAGKISSSTDGVTWTARTSGFGASAINDVVFSGDKFVAVGAAGKVATSTDGVTWTLGSTVGSYILDTVAYGNGVYVASNSVGFVYTSTDGITWSQSATTTNAIYNISYGNGLFVAGAAAGGIYTSTDGVTWTARSTPFTYPVVDVAYGNGVFVAVTNGDGSSNALVASSTNGINWTSNQTSVLAPNAITFGNNTFVTLGSDINNTPFVSSSSAGQYIYLAIA